MRWIIVIVIMAILPIYIDSIPLIKCSGTCEFNGQECIPTINWFDTPGHSINCGTSFITKSDLSTDPWYLPIFRKKVSVTSFAVDDLLCPVGEVITDNRNQCLSDRFIHNLQNLDVTFPCSEHFTPVTLESTVGPLSRCVKTRNLRFL
jgi:hypothetical protein